MAAKLWRLYPRGLTLELVGDANDYLGKGPVRRRDRRVSAKEVALTAARISLSIGNVALYGATGGKAFINGVAGESASACATPALWPLSRVWATTAASMTGGTVVVLGKTGKNFAAGMSGGIAHVLDEDWDFYQRVNKDMVSLEPVEQVRRSFAKDLIREHVEKTGSPRGKEILDNFGEYLPKFKEGTAAPITKDAALDRPDGRKGRGQRAGRRSKHFTR